MAKPNFTPIAATCGFCGATVEVITTPRLTSDRTPDGRGAVIFIEFNQAAIDRHAATHLTDEEAAA